MAIDDGLPLILKEEGGRLRQITFAGDDLPRDRSGFLTFGGSQRGTDQYPPGAREPTTQLLGPEEDDCTFSGVLNEGYPNRPQGLSALQMKDLIEALRQDGELVRVVYGPISKLCRWKEAKFTVAKLDTIYYSIVCKVVQVRGTAKPRVAKTLRDIPSTDKAVQAGLLVRQIILSLPPEIGAERLKRAKDTIAEAIGVTQSAGAVLDTFRKVGSIVDPGQATSALRLIDGAREQTKFLLEHVRAFDPSSDGFSLGRQATRARTLEASAKTIALGTELLNLRSRAQVLAGDTKDDVQYVVSQGENLRSIASKFYGSPDRWKQIAAANAKDSTTVSAGELLTIPQVGTGSEART